MWKKLQMCWGKVLNQNNCLADGGKRSGGYEKELLAARTEALREMEARAKDMGANAIIGVKMDYEVLGTDNGMLMVTCSGTAVVI